jgi:two-component system phosphate regulon sensor histidine kinase PhoR
MNLREIYYQLNLPAQCKRYNVSLWQCPQFLFLIMGIIIIIAAIVAYLIGIHYIENPQLIALIVLGLSGILFIFAYLINISFEKLAEASRIRTEFVRIVSHQLRSPITNLSWAIDSLMAGDLGRIEKSQLEYFKILKENSSRMKELIKDLLITSRIEEGTLPIKKEKVSLIEITKNLISQFLPFARASNVEIKFDFDKNLPEVFTDPNQIKVAIENLLDNAIRYIGRKGEVKIDLKKREKEILFEIKDNGLGIPYEDQKYIFQKFFRSKSKEGGGTGLGLFITKSIIEKLGGKIWFESKEGEGTKFYFTLPIK